MWFQDTTVPRGLRKERAKKSKRSGCNYGRSGGTALRYRQVKGSAKLRAQAASCGVDVANGTLANGH